MNGTKLINGKEWHRIRAGWTFAAKESNERPLNWIWGCQSTSNHNQSVFFLPVKREALCLLAFLYINLLSAYRNNWPESLSARHADEPDETAAAPGALGAVG